MQKLLNQKPSPQQNAAEDLERMEKILREQAERRVLSSSSVDVEIIANFAKIRPLIGVHAQIIK